MSNDETIDRDFPVVMRGYDRGEVDRHLTQVAASVEQLRRRVVSLEDELERAREAARTPDAEAPASERYGALGEETTRILLVAEESAREMTERAEQHAEAEIAAAERAARERLDSATEHATRLVAEAEERRDRMAEESEAARTAVEEQIARLQEARGELVTAVRTAVEAVTAAVDHLGEPPADAVRGGDARERDDRSVAQEGQDLPEAGRNGHDPDATDGQDVWVGQDAEHGPGVAQTPSGGEHRHDAGGAPTIVIDAVELDGAGVAIASSADAAAETRVVASEPEEELPAAARRERSLAGVRPGTLRNLRRGLQELQNGVLQRIRDRDGESAKELLPEDEASEQLVGSVRPFLDDASRAGFVDGTRIVGAHVERQPEADAGAVADAAEQLASELLDELHTTLLPSLQAGIDADEPDASLSERVGEVFRDLKGPIVETVAERHLVRTYGLALFAAWRGHDVERVEWVLGEETRCPEGKCRTNAAEGPVTLGAAFPSGDAMPQVHDGCTCAVAPAAR